MAGFRDGMGDGGKRTLDAAGKLAIYREMLRIRIFEQAAMQSYIGGKIGGWLNLRLGQEAVAVGVRSVMGPEDHSISGMGGIGHALAAGLTMREGMAELFGKVGGSAKGKAGMLGLYAPQHRHWGNHGLAGTQTALATGLAFGLKHRNEPGVVCCFLGEGSMNQGVVHESFNLAALFGLPVLFIIENNGYAMGMTEARSSATGGCLAKRAEGYGMEWRRLEHDNIDNIRAETWPLIERARVEQKPALIEIKTYRFEGFVIADAMKYRYRSREEVEKRQRFHDPLVRWRWQLESEGVATKTDFDALRHEAQAEAKDAQAFAESSPWPDPEAIWEDVYWEVDNAQPRGRHFF